MSGAARGSRSRARGFPRVPRASYPLRPGNFVRPLVDGEPAFRRIGEAVLAARRSVWVTIAYVDREARLPDGHGTRVRPARARGGRARPRRARALLARAAPARDRARLGALRGQRRRSRLAARAGGALPCALGSPAGRLLPASEELDRRRRRAGRDRLRRRHQPGCGLDRAARARRARNAADPRRLPRAARPLRRPTSTTTSCSAGTRRAIAPSRAASGPTHAAPARSRSRRGSRGRRAPCRCSSRAPCWPAATPTRPQPPRRPSPSRSPAARRACSSSISRRSRAARSSLYLENQAIGSPGVVDALEAALARGVEVVFLVPGNAHPAFVEARQEPSRRVLLREARAARAPRELHARGDRREPCGRPLRRDLRALEARAGRRCLVHDRLDQRRRALLPPGHRAERLALARRRACARCGASCCSSTSASTPAISTIEARCARSTRSRVATPSGAPCASRSPASPTPSIRRSTAASRWRPGAAVRRRSRRPAHQRDQRREQHEEHEDHEVAVAEGEHRGLGGDAAVERVTRRLQRARRIHAARGEARHQRREALLRRGRERRDALREIGVVQRAAVIDQRREHRDAHAAARLAEQVEQPCALQHVGRRQRAQRRHRERHEQEAHRDAAADLRPEQIPATALRASSGSSRTASGRRARPRSRRAAPGRRARRAGPRAAS